MPLLLTGCSLSLPVFGSGHDEPATTGSIAAPVDVQRPLPPTLAYSDAAKIGQAAVAAMWQAQGGDMEWINAATGSSGILEQAADADPEPADACRPFSTTVTSFAGVHRYAGDVCQTAGGRPIMRIGEESS
jgi:hypothetical protein